VSDYSNTFLEHYRRPRNLGDLATPDAVAIVHDDSCGDVLRIALSLDGGAAGCERIAAVRFKAYGCAATIAVGSVLSELASGRLVQEARAISEGDLIDALGGLPAGRVHAAILGREALRAAIDRLPAG
jgi:nitrogen fixation NifU-like protein